MVLMPIVSVEAAREEVLALRDGWLAKAEAAKLAASQQMQSRQHHAGIWYNSSVVFFARCAFVRKARLKIVERKSILRKNFDWAR